MSQATGLSGGVLPRECNHDPLDGARLALEYAQDRAAFHIGAAYGIRDQNEIGWHNEQAEKWQREVDRLTKALDEAAS